MFGRRHPPGDDFESFGGFGEVGLLAAATACREDEGHGDEQETPHAARSPTSWGAAFRSKRAKLVTTAKQTAGTMNEIAGLVASSRRPWINGMIAPPTIAITNPAAPNFVAGPSP